MSPNIKTSHVFAKNIFKIKEIKNPLGYLNLGITLINNKSDFEGTSN